MSYDSDPTYEERRAEQRRRVDIVDYVYARFKPVAEFGPKCFSLSQDGDETMERLRLSLVQRDAVRQIGMLYNEYRWFITKLFISRNFDENWRDVMQYQMDRRVDQVLPSKRMMGIYVGHVKEALRRYDLQQYADRFPDRFPQPNF